MGSSPLVTLAACSGELPTSQRSLTVGELPTVALATDCGGGINNWPKDPDDKTPSPILVRVEGLGSTSGEKGTIAKHSGDKTLLSSLGHAGSVGSVSDCGAPPSNPDSPGGYYPSPPPNGGGGNPEGNGPGGGGGAPEDDGGPLPPNADYGRPVPGTLNVIRGGEESTCNDRGICAPNTVVIKALMVIGKDNEGNTSQFILKDVVLRRVRSAGLIDEGSQMRGWYAFERGEFKQVRVYGSSAQLLYMIRLEMISTFQLQGTDWGGGIAQAGDRAHPFFYNSAWGSNSGGAEGIIWIPLGPRF